MKRLATCCYFLLLTGLNVLFAWYLTFEASSYLVVLRNVYEGKALPLYTEWFCQYLWWPWAGVAICVVGVTLSLLKKTKASVLINLLVIFLIVELGFMFATVVAFHCPFYNWLVALSGLP